jgi:hypothetical protein
MMKHFALILLVLGACGANRKQQAEAESTGFHCRDRYVSYMVVKDISGAERGVQMDCANGPRIKRWRTDKQGKRDEDDHPINPVLFDETWREVDGTGWPNLRDCSNGSLEKTDPVYQFSVKDDTNSATFECQTREVPFPYFDITQPLDKAANKGKAQLGDDEPADAKALDKKDKNR